MHLSLSTGLETSIPHLILRDGNRTWGLLMLPEEVDEEIIKQSSPLGPASPPTVAEHSREEDPSGWEGIVNLGLVLGLFLMFNSNRVLVAASPRHSLMCSPPVPVSLWIFLFPNGEERKSGLLPKAAWVTTSSDGDATWRWIKETKVLPFLGKFEVTKDEQSQDHYFSGAGDSWDREGAMQTLSAALPCCLPVDGHPCTASQGKKRLQKLFLFPREE